MDWWTGALVPALGNNTITMNDVVGAAITGDKVGTFGGQVVTENGQRIGRGEMFKLRDPDAQSWHAVLIAGNVDQDSARADVTNMYDTLVNAWGDPATNANVSISVLFGNGTTDAAGQPLPAKWNAQPATFENFQSTLTTVKGKLNSNEQFLMYVTDHGGATTRITNLPPGGLPGGVGRNGSFSLSEGELSGYEQDPRNASPFVLVDFGFPGPPGSGNVDLSFNDMPLGSFPPLPGLNQLRVPVPEGLLGQNNIFSIRNQTSIQFDVLGAEFEGSPLRLSALDADLIPERFTLIDNFDQVNEFGGPLALNLLAAGRNGQARKDFVNVPDTGVTRGHNILVTSQGTGATATLVAGPGADGKLRLNFVNAQTGDRLTSQLIYLLDPENNNLNYPDGVVFEVQLAEAPVAGQFNLLAGLFGAGPPQFVELHTDTIPNLYRGVLDTGGPLNLEDIDAIAFQISLTAGSDARVVIDSIQVTPEPVLGILLIAPLIARLRDSRRAA